MTDGPDAVELVAVALPRADAARAIVALWEAGQAVLPLDSQAPTASIRRVLEVARPTYLFDASGKVALRDGEPASPGVAAVVMTSGTTGRPKAAELTAAGIRASSLAVAGALGAGPDDRWLCCLPLASVAGLAIVARAWHTGAGLEVHERFEPSQIRRARDATLVSLVPTMLQRLLTSRVALGHFRCVLLGGGPVPSGLRERAAERGGRVVATYGLTETFGGVVHDGHPLDGVTIDIAACDGAPGPAGGVGEVLVRGPMVMRRYLSDEEGTAAALAGGALHTGDLGRIDGGRLTVLGRLDDLIITGGVSVQPAEVEAVLAEHPAVADVGVRGRPDPEWGERVAAFVVPREPAAPPGLEELRAFARERLPAAKAPRELIVVRAIPRTPSGKILRRLLRPEPGE